MVSRIDMGFFLFIVMAVLADANIIDIAVITLLVFMQSVGFGAGECG